MARILIIGGTGMLGHRLALTLSSSHTVSVTTRSDISKLKLHREFEKAQIKIISGIEASNFNHIERTICLVQPEIVINCVGIVKQLDDSKKHTIAISINSLFPQRIADLSQKVGFRLILFSTDCVFNGETGGYTEESLANADDLYGMTKLLGEVKGLKNVLTIRTSIIGREVNGKKSLIEWFLSQNQEIKGYKNVFFSGFPTLTISRIIKSEIIPNKNLHGIYHISSERISKYNLLQKLNSYYNLNRKIAPDTDIKLDRSLKSNKFQKDTGYAPPSWNEIIKDLLIKDPLYQD